MVYKRVQTEPGILLTTNFPKKINKKKGRFLTGVKESVILWIKKVEKLH